MDKINLLGRDVTTYYGPNLAISAVVFIDDVTGMGGQKTANNLIFNCSIMEEKKKMTFNNKTGKTEYMVVQVNKNDEVKTVTEKVKKGYISRVKEHKMLGTWLDESFSYALNITKRKKKLHYMIGSINRRASPSKIGIYAVQARLVLAESVIIPSMLHDVEGFPVHTDGEIKQLEQIQYNILTGILRLPQSTPYCALLMEVGWWKMRARIAYRKLMLYHNILRSDEKRLILQLIKVQKDECRETTWYSSVQREIKKYAIEMDPKEVLKSTWKKEVKRKITEKEESEIREKCASSTKARFVSADEYKMKDYLAGKTHLMEARKIMMTRLNMCKIPGNFKGNGDGKCTLCEEDVGKIEHYLVCPKVKMLAEVWEVKEEDLISQEVIKMKNLSKFMEKVEVMIHP